MKFITIVILLLGLMTGHTAAGVDRVEVSPAAVINLSAGHSGALMGGALTGDIFFNEFFALRTTLGITKNRYFPAEEPYSEADYGLWLSISPYAELNVANAFRPYLAVQGSFSSWGGYGPGSPSPAFNLDRAPVNRIQPAATRSNAYSFGATVGSKIGISGPVSLFAEVTHFFFTSFGRTDGTTFTGNDTQQNTGGIVPGLFYYDWDETPTYISLGLSYSLSIGDDK